MTDLTANNSSERIRVLRIAHASLTPALRERERALVRLYPNVDLEVVTARRWREAEVEVDATSDPDFPVRRARTHLSKHIQLFAYDPRPIIAALKRHQPHVIDANHEPYSIACAEVISLRNWFCPTAPIVLQVAQNIFKRYPPPFSWLEKRALREVAAAYVCDATAGEVLRLKGFKKPTPVVPFGVNTNAFTPRPPASSKSSAAPTIGYVGRMMPGKGLNLLADALEKLKTEDWRLLVIGDGPDRHWFEQTLVERGLRNRAVLLGAVPHEHVAALYQQLDLLVVPTQTTSRIREQFGRVLVEAMASGVPVIGSTCGAIPSVVDAAGIIFPEGDADALAAALRTLLADPQMRDRLARAGRERVRLHYSWDRVAEQTHSLFCKVLSRGHQPVTEQDWGRGLRAPQKEFKHDQMGIVH